MEKSLQIYLPFPKAQISQRFGENATSYYASQGLKGHSSYDWMAMRGTPILNCVQDAYCYSLMNKDNSDMSKYRAVFTLVETETGIYEVSYGHLDQILAEEGKTYRAGDALGTMGNTGPVFVGDHEVTNAEKVKGSQMGVHLHGPQVRPVIRVKKVSRRKKYLTTSNGNLYLDGYYFEIEDYDNGYNGCISLAPFSTETLAKNAPRPSQAVTDAVAKALLALQDSINQFDRIPVEKRGVVLSGWQGILAKINKLLNK